MKDVISFKTTEVKVFDEFWEFAMKQYMIAGYRLRTKLKKRRGYYSVKLYKDR